MMDWIETALKSEKRFIYEPRNPKPDTDLPAQLERSRRGLSQGSLCQRRDIGQPFPTATGIEEIVALYADVFTKLDFDVQFDVQEIEFSGDLGFVRTRSHGTIVPKGQNPEGSDGNREIFVVKKIDGEWKFYRYIFNAEVRQPATV